MRIASIDGFALSSPYGSGRALGQPLGVKSVGLVELRTDTGVTGYGETYAGVYAPELIEPSVAFLRSTLIGRPVEDREAISDTLARIPFVGRNGLLRSVASAIDTALWDVDARRRGVPVWKLLAESSRRPPVYASGGSAAFSPAEMHADLDAVLAAGFAAYKMRVGIQSWSVDLERVGVARERLGPAADLMVDAIMGTISPPWTLEMAAVRAADLRPFGLRWLEEPLTPDDLTGLAALRSCCTIPIAVGEAYSGMPEFREAMRAGVADVLQPDVTHCGGLTEAVAISRHARQAGVQMALHVWGSAVAISANLQLAVADTSITYLEVPMVQLEMATEMWVDCPRIADGRMAAPESPGLGISITPEMKQRYKFVPGSGYRLPVRSS